MHIYMNAYDYILVYINICLCIQEWMQVWGFVLACGDLVLLQLSLMRGTHVHIYIYIYIY